MLNHTSGLIFLDNNNVEYRILTLRLRNRMKDDVAKNKIE